MSRLDLSNIRNITIDWDGLASDFDTMLDWVKKNAKEFARMMQTHHDAIQDTHRKVREGKLAQGRGNRNVRYRMDLIDVILRTCKVRGVNKAAEKYRATNRAIVDILSALATGAISAL